MLSPIVANAPINAIVFSMEGITMRFLASRSADTDTPAMHALAGGISGLAQSVLSCPSELVKIRLQMQIDAGTADAFRGPLDCARHLLRTEGLSSLYRGMAATMLRDGPAFAVYFATYHGCKDLIRAHFPSLCSEQCDVASATTPHAEYAGERGGWQMPDLVDGDAAGSLDVNSGPGPWTWASGFELWPGMIPTLDRRRRLDAETPPPTAPRTHHRPAVGALGQLISGGIAGTMSWLLLHPVDVIKSVVQGQTPATPFEQRGAIRAAMHHLRHDGPAFFLRGLTPTIVRAFPTSAVIFVVYESILPLLTL